MENHTEHDKHDDKNSTQVEEKVLNHIEGTVTSVFLVSGMDCADEIAAIQSSLNHPKVAKVVANLMTSQVTVDHDPSLKNEELVGLINKAGVKVREKTSNLSFVVENKTRVTLVGVSGLLVAVGLVFQYLYKISDNILFLIYLGATLSGGSLIFPKAIRAVKKFTLDMNVLMVLAAVGAFIIKEYSEGAAVVFLFSLAEMLEAFSVARARKAIREVLSIVPQVANLIKDKSFVSVPIEEILIGQEILIRAGDRVPLDGTIILGTSYVNQAPLTGESQPVSKDVGSTVLAGTINESSNLNVKVTHTYKDTKIANVIKLIEEAQSKKAPAQLFVDKFARIYTPVVTLVAILVCLIPPLLFSQSWDLWFYRSLVFLVIACPCALVIATPVSVVSALTALAKSGVLVKGGVYLEALGKLRAIAVDKTGTITEGKPQVVSAKVWKNAEENEFFKIALALENPSTHPLAKAVVEFCEKKQVDQSEVLNYQVIPGKGVQADIGSDEYFAGNHKLTHELGVCGPEVEGYLQKLEEQAQSVMIVGKKPKENKSGEILGIFGLADKPREGMQQAIKNLHLAGIKEVVILSGDNQRTVDAIAKLVGIDKAQGDLLPENKVIQIQALSQKHKYVGMVGDGINDAPALAQASVGIAMGAAGTDAAIETADIALMTDDIGQLAGAINHGRKTLGIIRFNIGFALAIKAVFIVLGIFGLSNLWLAVAADSGASLLVIANSLRLLSVQKVV
ncbi:MAG: heavy metal translocating P-type ATPase [Bdellovibrio sp. 28-41-41]|nr:MAG: heavy metal translocating P-type ATPase [Bdellovibrio sp. 28-41-41]